MSECDNIATIEFIKKRKYKKINHDQLGQLSEIYFFIRIMMRQLCESAAPKNDEEKKIQKEANSTEIINLTFTNFISNNFNIDKKYHSKILKPIVASLKD